MKRFGGEEAGRMFRTGGRGRSFAIRESPREKEMGRDLPGMKSFICSGFPVKKEKKGNAKRVWGGKNSVAGGGEGGQISGENWGGEERSVEQGVGKFENRCQGGLMVGSARE